MNFLSKIFLLILGTVLATAIISNVTFTLTAQNVVFSGLSSEAFQIADTAAKRLSANPLRIEEYRQLLQGISPSRALKDSIDQSLRELQSEFAPLGIENVYTIMLIDDELKVAGDPSDGSPMPLTQTDGVFVGFKTEIFATAQTMALDAPYTDEYGVWISAYGPVIDSEENVLAIVGVDLPIGAFPLIGDIVQRNLLISLIPAILIAVLVSFFASRKLTKPLKQLTMALIDVRQGNFEKTLDFDSRDEFGDMARTFNDMLSGLKEREKLKSTLQQAVSPEIASKLLSGSMSMEGELVEGTVLFADVRGFTSLSDTISASETIAFINQFLALSVPCILENGGVIEKFVGDEIFAIFGVAQSLHQDARRAVDAAIQVQNAIKKNNELRATKSLPEINIGIGINTGMMIAGVIGIESRNNYTVLGSTVNEGARICSAAAAGEIIISQSTYLRVNQFFNVEELPALEAKGKTFSMNVFRVISPKDTPKNEKRDA